MRILLGLLVALSAASVTLAQTPTCNDIRVGTSAFTPATGGTASVTLTGSFVTAPSYNVSGTSSTFTISFGSAVFTGAPTCTATPGTSSLTWSASTSGAVATVASASAIIIGGSNVSWSCVGASGTPSALQAGKLCVSTTRDATPRCGDVPALGGVVTVGTALTLVDADKVGNKATSGVVTIVFSPVNPIPINGVITINVPHMFFAARTSGTATGCTIACTGTACGSAVLTTGVGVAHVAASGNTAAYTQVTAIVTGAATSGTAVTVSFAAGILTTGTPQAATTAGVTVSTSVDQASVGSASPALSNGVCPASTTAGAAPNAKKSPASFLYISASFVLAFVFAVLA